MIGLESIALKQAAAVTRSLAWPDRFFPFLFMVTQIKTEKSDLLRFHLILQGEL